MCSNRSILVLIIVFSFLSSNIFIKKLHCNQDEEPEFPVDTSDILLPKINKFLEDKEYKEVTCTLNKATIFISILVHPWNKLPFLYYIFGALENQEYDKKKIHVQIRTEKLFDTENHCSDKIMNENSKSINFLHSWTHHFASLYKNIDLLVENEFVNSKNYQHLCNELQNNTYSYWTQDDSYKRLAVRKESALQDARQSWADVFLTLDADIILTNKQTLNHFSQLLVSPKLNQASSQFMLVSPMLKSSGQFSNFWASISNDGFYETSDKYFDYLEYKTKGQFAVPMIHSCIFINLRCEECNKKVSFLPTSQDLVSRDDELTYDDMLMFSRNALRQSIQMFVDNSQVWGFIPPFIDELNGKDLIESNNLALTDLRLSYLYLTDDESQSKQTLFELSEVINSSNPDYKNPLSQSKIYGIDKIFVLNLEKRRPNRRYLIAKAFELLGIEFEFFNQTVDGNEQKSKMISENNITVDTTFRDPIRGRKITWGEIGCFLSHYNAWKEIIDKNYKQVLILEDDFKFNENFIVNINSIVQEQLPLVKMYDLVYLTRKNLDKTDEIQLSTNLVIPNYSYWLIGYLLTQSGAAKLIDAKPLDCLIPADEFVPLISEKNSNSINSTGTSRCISKYRQVKNLLKILAINPSILEPQYYPSDKLYISDTENSHEISS